MPVGGLEGWLAATQQMQRLPLEVLKDTRLGIDVNHYVRQLLTSEDYREPMVAAVGGYPTALASVIEKQMKSLEDMRITPILVFNGLPLAATRKMLYGSGRRNPSSLPGTPASTTRSLPGGSEYGGTTPGGSSQPFLFMDAEAQRFEAACRDAAWTRYESGEPEVAISMWEAGPRKGMWIDPAEITKLVWRVVRHRYIDFIVAPYSSHAQLAYFVNHPKSYIHSVCGPTEMLMYPTTRVIHTIDFATSSFSFYDKQIVMQHLAIGPDQLIDLCLLSGSDILPRCPLLTPRSQQYIPQEMLPPPGHIAAVLKQAMTGIRYLLNCQNEPSIRETGYTESFVKARAAIRFALVMTDEGTCAPLPLVCAAAAPILPSDSTLFQPTKPSNTFTAPDIPSDLDTIFSSRLPEEMYYYLSRGLVSPTILGWVTSGRLEEARPLDDGGKIEYQKFVANVLTRGETAPRNMAVTLLLAHLNPAWRDQHAIYASYYFEEQPNWRENKLQDLRSSGLIARSTKWRIPGAVIDDELRQQNSSNIDFKLCLGATKGAAFADLWAASESNNKILDRKDELIANALLRFLSLRGFLVLPKNTQSPIGEALYKAISSSRLNDKFQEPLYMALELIRAGALHGDLWDREEISGGASMNNPSDNQCMLLFMRSISILPLLSRNKPWSGPLSRELLVFNSFINGLSRTLRLLIEAICVQMLMSGEAKKHRDDFPDVACGLPFQNEGNTGFGILVKVFIDATVAYNDGEPLTADNEQTPEVQAAKESAIGILEDTFITIKAPEDELKRGFRFWDALYTAVKHIGPSSGLGITQELYHVFERTDKWLSPYRPGGV
ncbi:hypothetical protein NliqN6_3742 [Naganishia liquefaciens]|uniref:XPG N-terminal domain-containing protein n=1 Tax=Naganishia liquefaciens TaxID=104408 RepID=A0A8H3YF56_9TREE|nr:hypothetical protein NliqN6_3742 [Naganishia liquefaciens]